MPPRAEQNRRHVSEGTRDPVSERSAEIERMVWRRRIETFVGSRDAAHALASSSPAEGTTLTKVVGVAAELARYADDSIAKVKDRYHPALDCKAGCSYCCSKPGVLTSVPDLLRILVHIRSVFSETEIAELTDRARRYAAQMQGRNCNDPTNESVPCPLLEDKRCSVYEVRPLVCRGYNSTNVNACRSAHENSTVMVPVFALIKDVTDGATVGAAQQLKEEGLNGSMVDLGSALNIAVTAGAFTDGSGFPEAIAVGDSALLPAENSSWVTELWEQVCEVARQLG